MYVCMHIAKIEVFSCVSCTHASLQPVISLEIGDGDKFSREKNFKKIQINGFENMKADTKDGRCRVVFTPQWGV